MQDKRPPSAGPQSILLIEDSPSLSAVYREYLRPGGYEVTLFERGEPALSWLESNTPDAVLLDLNLPDMGGLDVLREIKRRGIPVEVLIITAHGSVDNAVEAIRAGAADFLEKPFDAERLRTSLANVLEKHVLRRQVEDYRRTFSRDRYQGFIGSSLAMQAVYRIIDSAAPSKAAVFITGESGTGKEVCAEAIHRQSKRKDGPFIPLNCAAIPRDLMESEIFGHLKGAFTGAHAARDGAASRADGGSLFLDEVCEMDLDLQSKLLRFIQTGTFQKVGSGKLEQVDIRIICATNRDPVVEVREGRFREDLFYRLHVIPIALPPLRERAGDVMTLARYFLAQYASEEEKRFEDFAPEAERMLTGHQWPGNVRELQNTIRNAVVLNDGHMIEAGHLSTLGSMAPSTRAPSPADAEPRGVDRAEAETAPAVIKPLWEVEKQAIESAIDQCGGNVPKAAALLEVSASTLYRKLQSWKDQQ